MKCVEEKYPQLANNTHKLMEDKCSAGPRLKGA